MVRPGGLCRVQDALGSNADSFLHPFYCIGLSCCGMNCISSILIVSKPNSDIEAWLVTKGHISWMSSGDADEPRAQYRSFQLLLHTVNCSVQFQVMTCPRPNSLLLWFGSLTTLQRATSYFHATLAFSSRSWTRVGDGTVVFRPLV